MNRRAQTASLLATAVTALSIAGGTSRAANVTWTGGNPAGSWSDPSKWNTGSVPGTGDNVWIDSAGTAAKVNLDASIGDVALVTIDSNDTLNVSVSGLWNPAQSMVVNGTVNLNSPTTGIGYVGAGSAYLGGSRSVAGSLTGQTLLAAPAGGLSIGSGLSINGAVKQVAGSGPVVNSGIISNNLAGTTTELGADATATFTNGGTVQVYAGSDLVWNDVSNGGTVNLGSGSTFTARPLPGSVTPGAIGVVNLTAGAVLALDYSAPSAPALPVGALAGVNMSTGGKVQVNGQLDNAGNTIFPQQGVIELSRPAATPYGKGTIVGGTIQTPGSLAPGLVIPANAFADLDGVNVRTSTYVQSGATLFAHNVTLGSGGAFEGYGGTLVMASSASPSVITPIPSRFYASRMLAIVGDIPNLGNLSPASATTPSMTVDGEVAIVDGGGFLTEIGGPGGIFGQVAITGSLDLTRTTDYLEADRFPGSFPAGSFTVITATGGVNGTFDTVTLPAGWTVSYTPTTVVVNVVPEPASLAVLAVAAGTGMFRRRRAH